MAAIIVNQSRQALYKYFTKTLPELYFIIVLGLMFVNYDIYNYTNACELFNINNKFAILCKKFRRK